MDKEKNDFKIGGLVRLKSGGPIMTISAFVKDSYSLECTWFAKTKSTGCEILFTKAFPQFVLDSVDRKDVEEELA